MQCCWEESIIIGLLKKSLSFEILLLSSLLNCTFWNILSISFSFNKDVSWFSIESSLSFLSWSLLSSLSLSNTSSSMKGLYLTYGVKSKILIKLSFWQYRYDTHSSSKRKPTKFEKLVPIDSFHLNYSFTVTISPISLRFLGRSLSSCLA